MSEPRYTIMRGDVSMVNAAHFGETRDSATILEALIAIGGDQALLLLPDDDTGGVWTLLTDVTIPSNVILSIPCGVTVTGTGSLTIAGGLQALRADWFQSSGTLIWLGGASLWHFNALRAGPTRLSVLTLDTPLAITEGGTSARTAPDARRNLGLELGVNVQAWDAELQAISDAGSASDTLFYYTGVGAGARTLLTPLARSLLDDATPGAMQATMGLGALAPLSLVTTPYVTDRAVTYAKVQNVAAARLLGNPGASPGVVGEISLGAGLALTGSVLDLSGTALGGAGVDNRVGLWCGTAPRIGWAWVLASRLNIMWTYSVPCKPMVFLFPTAPSPGRSEHSIWP
jgi:Repeat of unknown function (DUF5907)